MNVARAALRRLARLGGGKEVEELRARLLSVDLGLVPDYAATLRALRDKEAAALARRGLDDPAPTVRLAAALALGELVDEASAPALRTAAGDRIAGVRRFAIEALGRLGPSPASEAVCAVALRDSDPEVRAAAVRALAHIASDLEARLEPAFADPVPRVRREVARACGGLSEGAVRALVLDPDADVRATAVWALVERPRPALLDVLVAAADDPSWHVRRAACRALGAARREGARARLVRSLVDPHATVRAEAARALREIFGEKLLDALSGELPSADARVRCALVYRLAELGGEDATSRIVELANDESAEVRVAVAHALGEVGRSAAARVLERLAQDGDPDVRAAALTALRRVRGADAG